MIPLQSVLAMLVAAAAGQDSAPAVESAAAADLAWMSGAWSMTRGGATVEEFWSQPAGGTLFGFSRTIRGDKTVEFEFLRIESIDGRLHYVAQPGGRAPTRFRLTRLTAAREAVFENPEHDAPQKITYQRRGETELHARVEGGMPALEFAYRRATP
ncbi:MAG: hypothetical protein CHACPFDD_00742 [Phycisphaerae bacterium]|nr:hypothetical protein [Phycisphaerae bacterium]